MPCEGCHVQFTVFRRKRSCSDCKRFYCINCLSPSRQTSQQIALCERCAIFAKRPLLRTDLLKLKPKDLIFYLQSKHVSTTGCVEKEELIVLIMDHVQQIDAACPGSDPNINNSHSDAEQGNSFDSFKQTCQNFFSNITENIGDSFSSLNEKSKFKSYHDINRGTQTPEAYISDQPRISRREIPTYASFQINRQAQSAPLSDQVTRVSDTRRNSASPPQTDYNTDREQMQYFIPVTSANNELGSHGAIDQEPAGCECSDDELIAIFNEHMSTTKLPKLLQDDTSGTLTATTTKSCGREETSDFKATMCQGDESSQSSFEELGAIGGISDDSKATTDTNSSNIDQWQVLDTQHDETVTEEGQAVPQDQKRVIRRRSDGYLNRRRPQSDDESPTCMNLAPQTGGADLLQEKEETRELEEWRINCKRCGKNKFNIKKRVERMRRHLESSQMSETDIKRELKEFLTYLEHRTKSIDWSDSETVSSALGGATCTQVDLSPNDHFDENDGIHVYAAPSSFNSNDSRFINLDNFDSLHELETLSVKQLKEVLMLHRVDYKGCCEKQELLDRVERLWKNLKSYPASDKLPTDELCKICMDAPIECVILECGHMATCTNCGKVLSECPICRQYIVRVVRFFRA